MVIWYVNGAADDEKEVLKSVFNNCNAVDGVEDSCTVGFIVREADDHFVGEIVEAIIIGIDVVGAVVCLFESVVHLFDLYSVRTIRV